MKPSKRTSREFDVAFFGPNRRGLGRRYATIRRFPRPAFHARNRTEIDIYGQEIVIGHVLERGPRNDLQQIAVNGAGVHLPYLRFDCGSSITPFECSNNLLGDLFERPDSVSERGPSQGVSVHRLHTARSVNPIQNPQCKLHPAE